VFAEYIAWFCVVLLQVALAGASAALWMYRQTSIEDHQNNIDDGLFAVDSKQDKDALQAE
jgi:hypothetical protein